MDREMAPIVGWWMWYFFFVLCDFFRLVFARRLGEIGVEKDGWGWAECEHHRIRGVWRILRVANEIDIRQVINSLCVCGIRVHEWWAVFLLLLWSTEKSTQSVWWGGKVSIDIARCNWTRRGLVVLGFVDKLACGKNILGLQSFFSQTFEVSKWSKWLSSTFIQFEKYCIAIIDPT